MQLAQALTESDAKRRRNRRARLAKPAAERSPVKAANPVDPYSLEATAGLANVLTHLLK